MQDVDLDHRTFAAASSASFFFRNISSTLRGCRLGASPHPFFFFFIAILESTGVSPSPSTAAGGGGGGTSSGGGGGAAESGGGGGAFSSGGGGGGDDTRSSDPFILFPFLWWPFIVPENCNDADDYVPQDLLMSRVHRAETSERSSEA